VTALVEVLRQHRRRTVLATPSCMIFTVVAWNRPPLMA
jgi:hypothetical protein